MSRLLFATKIIGEIVIRLPEELNYKSSEIVKLKKTVYGLKDGSEQWYLRVKEEPVKLGMEPCNFDSTLMIFSLVEMKSSSMKEVIHVIFSVFVNGCTLVCPTVFTSSKIT